MWPVFIARGPAFKKGYMPKEAIRHVDLYALMCHLLDIDPNDSDGNLDNIKHILVQPEEYVPMAGIACELPDDLCRASNTCKVEPYFAAISELITTSKPHFQ